VAALFLAFVFFFTTLPPVAAQPEPEGENQQTKLAQPPDAGRLTATTTISGTSSLPLAASLDRLLHEENLSSRLAWITTRQVLLYRKLLLKHLFEQRTSLQTDLALLGETPVRSDELWQVTTLAFGQDLFPNLWEETLLPAQALENDSTPSPGSPEELEVRTSLLITEALRLVQFDREIGEILDRYYVPPTTAAMLPQDGLMTLPSAIFLRPSASDQRKLTILRKAQRSFTEAPILFTPVAGFDSGLRKLDPALYDRVIGMWSRDEERSCQSAPRLYHTIAFLALLRLGASRADDEDLGEIELDSVPPGTVRPVMSALADAERRAIQNNTEAILGLVRLSPPGVAEQALAGYLGTTPSHARQLKEPEDVLKLIRAFLHIVPLFSSQPDLLHEIEVTYGIPIAEQQRANRVLLAYGATMEKKREANRRNSQRISIGLAVLTFPISIALDAPLMLFALGLIDCIYWIAVTSQDWNEGARMKDLAEGLVATLDPTASLGISLEDLDRYLILEQEAFTQYLVSIGILGASVAGLVYLRFVRKASLFGRTAVVIDEVDLESLQPRIRELTREVRGLLAVTHQTDDLATVASIEKSLGMRAKNIVTTMTSMETRSVQVVSDSIWTYRSRLDSQIGALLKQVEARSPVKLNLKHPDTWQIGKKRFFELHAEDFKRELGRALEAFPGNAPEVRAYKDLLLRRYVCERAQRGILGPLTSPKNHPSVVRPANAIKGGVGWLGKRKWVASTGARVRDFKDRLPWLEDLRRMSNETWISFTNFRKAAEKTELGHFLRRLTTDMDFDALNRYRGVYVNKGSIRRFLQIQRDHLIWSTPGDLMSREDLKKEWKDVALNYAVGFVQNFGRTWAVRENITLRRRLMVGAGFTMSASAIATITLNGAFYGHNVLDDPCLGAIFSRVAGNTLYAVTISEPKGRLAEIGRLMLERGPGKNAAHASALITGITVFDKGFGGWLWATLSKKADIQGRCKDSGPELVELLQNSSVLSDPRFDHARYLAGIQQNLGAIFEGSLNRLPPHPAFVDEFVADDPFETGETP